MKVYGLIGFPLAHSFSKKYFTEKFEKEKIRDCCFELFPIQQIEDFPGLVRTTAGLSGLAVTIPYKESVIPFLDSLDEKAKAIGAVNCIRFVDGKLRGSNTDAFGFEESISPLLADHHKKALVLGSGGSSKAVQYVLKKKQIAFLVVSREKNRRDGYITYDRLNDTIIENHKLIINCTPVGMYPNESAMPGIPYEHISPGHLLFDLIYRPEETRFLAMGSAKGATIKNGYEMLLLQAEENWRTWNSSGED
ncbi:MAG: shikimate dehydrogenase [Bacteroidetes bacterium]|nr:shikimate dehydrogenase [Bacteroidota bacterium]